MKCKLCGSVIRGRHDKLCKSCFDYLMCKYNDEEDVDERIWDYEMELMKNGRGNEDEN